MATLPTLSSSGGSTNFTASSTSPKTYSVTVAAGDLILFKGANGGADQTPQTPSGGTGLQWFRLIVPAGNTDLNYALAELWYAISATAQTFTLSASQAGSTPWGFTYEVWHNHGGIGAVATAYIGSTSTSAPSMTLTTISPNSAVSVILSDWTANVTVPTYRTVNGITPVSGGSGESGKFQGDGLTYGGYSFYYSDAGVAGAKTIGATAPTMRWTMISVEILSPDADSPTIHLTGTPTSATAAVTAVSPVVPTGVATTDLSVLTVWAKPYSTTITTPSGWTKIGEATNGTVASGTDLGSTKVAVYVKEGATAGAIGNIAQSGADSMGAVIDSYWKPPNTAWDYSQFTTGGDTTNGANYSATGAAGIGVAALDVVLSATAVNGDIGTPSAFAIAGMSGVTLGPTSTRVNSATTTGNDTRGLVHDITVLTGSSSAAPTFTYTNASSTSGTTLFLRLRVTGAIVASPTGIASSETFGVPSAVIPITASPSGIASALAFGTLIASIAGGPITASPTSISSTEAFGTPVVSTSLTAVPDGIATGEAFGTLVASNPGIQTTYNLLPISLPALLTASDPNPVSCGIEFEVSSSDCTVTVIRYVQAADQGLPNSSRVCAIYSTNDGSTGTLVAGPFTMPAPTPGVGGWVSYTLPTPFALTANQRYRAVVFHPEGQYVATSNQFGVTQPLGTNFVQGPLTRFSAPNAANGKQGSYEYFASLIFPHNAFGDANYWTDIEVSVASGPSNITVLPSGIASEEVFGTVSANVVQTVSPAGVISSEAFGTIAVSTAIISSPTGISSAEVFGAASISTVLISSPTGIASSEAFGTPVISTAITVSPVGIASASAFGAPVVTNVLTVTPAGIATGEAFGTPSIATTITSYPSGIPTGEAFGNPTVGATIPGQTLNPTAIASGEAFGLAAISTAITVSPAGIPSADAFGVPVVTATLTSSPTGIPTGEAFGTATVSTVVTASPAGVPSGESFGTVTVLGSNGVAPVGIPSAEAFGTLTATVAPRAFPVGIPSAEAFGVPTATIPSTVSPTGIPSSEAFGVPTVSTTITSSPVGVPSAQAFGVPTASTVLTSSPIGIPSGEAFGTLAVAKTIVASPTGIPSGLAFGVPVVGGLLVARPVGIVSQEQFGILFVDFTERQTPDVPLERFASVSIDENRARVSTPTRFAQLVVPTQEVSVTVQRNRASLTLPVRTAYIKEDS